MIVVLSCSPHASSNEKSTNLTLIATGIIEIDSHDITLNHSKQYDNVMPKLHEGTAASEANKVQKFERDIEDDGANSTSVKIIDPNSHLLQTTPAVANSMYKKNQRQIKLRKVTRRCKALLSLPLYNIAHISAQIYLLAYIVQLYVEQ